jgi:hypothetical protein
VKIVETECGKKPVMNYETIVPKASMQNLVMGHTIIQPPMVSMSLRGKYLKELAKELEDDDVVVIDKWSDFSDECREETFHGRVAILREKEA